MPCRGRGGRGLFSAPNFGGFGFGGPGGSPTQCQFANGPSSVSGLGVQLSPEVAIAGLRGLLTHAAPYLQGIVSSIDEQIIEQAILASVAETGASTGSGSGGAQNGTGTRQKFMEKVTVEKSGEKDMYRVDIVLGRDAKAESLKIKRKDNVVTIEVKTETSAKDGSSRLYQEYTRRITLPEHVDLTQLESVLSPEGTLTVKAPFSRKPEVEKCPRSVSVSIPVIVEENVTE